MPHTHTHRGIRESASTAKPEKLCKVSLLGDYQNFVEISAAIEREEQKGEFEVGH